MKICGSQSVAVAGGLSGAKQMPYSMQCPSDRRGKQHSARCLTIPPENMQSTGICIQRFQNGGSEIALAYVHRMQTSSGMQTAWLALLLPLLLLVCWSVCFLAVGLLLLNFPMAK